MLVFLAILIHFIFLCFILTCFSWNTFTHKEKSLELKSISRIRNININFAATLLISYYLVYVGTPTRLVFTIVVTLLIVTQLYSKRQSRSWQNWESVKINVLTKGYIFFSVLGGIWAVLPAIYLSAKNGVLLGMSTTGNNDIAMYAMLSTDYLTSGFSASNHLVGYSANIVAQTATYQGPLLLISMFSSLLAVNAWKVMSLVMCFAISYVILGLFRLAKEIYPSLREKMGLTIAIAIVLTPLVSYTTGNYFLAQVFAIGISANLVSIIMKVRSTDIFDRADGVELAALTVLSVFMYPHLLLPAVIASSLILIFILLRSKHPLNLNGKSTLLLFVLAGLLVSALPLKNTWEFIYQTFKMSGNGWPLPFLTPGAIFFNRRWIGAQFSPTIVISSWVIFTTIAIGIVMRSKIPVKLKKDIFIIGALVSIGTLYLLTQRNLPLDNYTNWKLLSYIMPIVGLVILSLIATLGRNYRVLLVFGFSILLVTPTIDWWSTVKSNIGTVTSSMQSLESNRELRNFRNININVDPWFETMALYSVLPDKQLALNGKNYIISAKNPGWCSLVRLDDLSQPTFIALNDTYGLAQSEDKTCGVPGKVNYFKVKNQEKFTFSSFIDRNRVLGMGWSVPEDWGIWSEGPTSSLKFQFTDTLSKKETLVLIGSIFLDENIGQEISFVINEKTVLVQKLENNDKLHTFKIDLPIDLINNNDGVVELLLKYKHPISPKQLNLSGDTRELAFGLISFELRPAD